MAVPVSIVYVTRNRADDLMRSLASLEAIDPSPDQVLVVDNDSSDGTTERLARERSNVEVLAQSTNLGVARARNLGIEAAANDIVVCLDDDARLETPDALSRIVERLGAFPRVTVIALRIVNAKRGETLGHEFPRRRLHAREVEREQEVAYFIGCGFAVRRAVFLDLGGFCPLIHYGLEELDLAYRLLEAGLDIHYDPAIIVEHGADPDARRGDAWHFHLMRSRVLVAVRNLPLWAALPHLGIWHAGMLGHGLLRGHAGAVLRGALAGWRLAPRAWEERRPISTRTARRVLRLSGRLFS